MDRRRFVSVSAGVALASVRRRESRTVSAQETFPGTEEADFVEAVDGATMKVMIGEQEETVRLIGVRAPEQEHDGDDPECGFEEAKEALTDAVSGRRIVLEPDVEDRNDEGHLLRHVWTMTPEGEDGILLNEQLLQDGWVTLQVEETNTQYAPRYQAMADIAEETSGGLYAICGEELPVTEPPPRRGSTENPGVLGERLEASGMAVTLQSAYATYSYGFSAPRGGYKFLVAELFLENISDGEKGYSDSRVKVKNLDNDAWYTDRYRPTDQPLGNGHLSTGSYIYGVVAVEIQETAHNLRFEYKINNFGGDIVYWNIVV